MPALWCDEQFMLSFFEGSGLKYLSIKKKRMSEY
jgi:hypothetical protein